MDFLPKGIEEYAEKHTTDESKTLHELNRETHLKVIQPRMLSGHLQGRFLSMISYMIKPQNVLEIGTYTGYSAICLAEGLATNGKITTIDVNEELKDIILDYFNKAQVSSKIDLKIGNALEIIPQLDEQFDLVFIDADKENYSNYFDIVLPKVKSGGYIIADNVLWSGKVIESNPDKDKATQGIIDFNKKVHQSDSVENLLLPIRDGLMILRKK